MHGTERTGPQTQQPGYKDRAARVDVRFPLEFTGITGERIQGTCQNLSESGLLARLSAELEVWTVGEVDLHFGTDLLGVKVRVARVMGLDAGMSFLYANERQRQQIRELIFAARGEGTLPSQL